MGAVLAPSRRPGARGICCAPGGAACEGDRAAAEGAVLKAKVMPVLDMAIEAGSRRGVARAYKHNDAPSHEAIAQSVHEAVLDEIHEWFDIEEAP